MYKIGINFDEISDDIHEAIQVMQECGVRYGELRTLNQKNFVFWTNDEVATFKKIIDAHGIEVIAAASPLFKWYTSTDSDGTEQESFGFNPRLSAEEQHIVITNAMNVAARLSIPRMRVFSGLGRTEQAGLHISQDPLFQKALALAAEQGITLYIENDPVCCVYTKQDVLDLLGASSCAKLRLWLDVANMVEVGEDIDEAFLSAISPRLGYIHVKDFVIRNNQKVYVPIGEGIIAYQAIFEKIYAAHPANDVIVTVETHARDNKADHSVRSLMGIQKILAHLGGMHDA